MVTKINNILVAYVLDKFWHVNQERSPDFPVYGQPGARTKLTFFYTIFLRVEELETAFLKMSLYGFEKI